MRSKENSIIKMIPIEFEADFIPPEVFDEEECWRKDCPFFLQDDNYGQSYCNFPNMDENTNGECPIHKYF